MSRISNLCGADEVLVLVLASPAAAPLCSFAAAFGGGDGIPISCFARGTHQPGVPKANRAGGQLRGIDNAHICSTAISVVNTGGPRTMSREQ